ncbi:nipped-B-like protein B [Aplysia californica]|uniref:Nipped-B protein n=1 Tax=Aplysia californica TaxID=6500 RepID=A0ABM0JBV4_APLCA|nr:nipped-B-like protein B [Aplysia californica]XP_035826328.1 nipped-B-like protein B [Aplysia californica]
MNGETPSVPITTLAGVASLTELLSQLPLPTPLPQTVQNKTLLYSPNIAEDARRLLASSDDVLGAQLSHALRQTTTSQIELKDNLIPNAVEGEIPSLLQAVMRKDPQIFQGNARIDGHLSHNQFSNFVPQGHRISQSQHHGSPRGYNQPGTSPRYNQNQPQRYQNNAYASPSSSPFQASGAGMGHSSNSVVSHNHQPNAVSSPAQATAAERVLPLPYAQNASPVSTHNSPDPLARHNRRTRNPPSVSANNSVDQQFQHGMKSQEPVHNISDKLPNRTCIQGAPARADPVIVLDDIGDQLNTSISRLPLPPHLAGSSVKSAHSPSEKSKSADTKKKNEPVVMLEMLDPSMLKTISKGGSVKTDCDNDSRKRKREETSYNISRAAGQGDISFQAFRSRKSDDTYKNRAAKRRRHSVESDDASSLSEFVEVEEDEEAYKARMKKKEKQNKKRLLQPVVSLEDLLDSPIFKKFNSCVDHIFDSAEDANFASIDKDNEDVECPPESLIARRILTDLCGEAAKLKAMNALSQIPPDRLVKLLTILLWNVRDGCKVTPNINQEEDEEESKLWRELTMDRVMRSMDASLTGMAVMTGRNMPKQVYLEDVIERVIHFAKFQLHNTIYPEFDPVYKIDPKAKDGYHGSLKAKRARAGSVKHKSTITLYNKMCELVSALANLLEIQELTDTIILQVSSLGVSAFFVENISELQLTTMKLVTTVFSRYSKHRQLILEDIFASLARLPSSKRNLRNYRLNSDESIQMVTALALQLIQCVVKLPDPDAEDSPDKEDKNKKSKGSNTEENVALGGDNDVVIVTSYETAMRTGYNFLSVFLKKCTTKGEEDYRPLFENFVQDLLTTVNKPEWPASELLLSLLGRILVQQFSSKSTDMSLRVASLEYLGIVAARLRKDAVTSQLNQEVINDIVQKVSENEEEESASTRSKKTEKSSPDVTERLQQAMLEYLAYNAQSESALFFARQFYIAQWFRDTTVEAEKTLKAQHNNSGDDQDEDFNEKKEETSTELMQNAEKRKAFLCSQISCSKRSNMKHAGAMLDYDSACLVARYLSSKRPFAQSFDIYLTQILKVLSETAVAVRTKAMKCLTAVVEADPGILARSDMQRGVHGRFLDQSTSVREAAIELVGKFILIQPDLIPNYYDMLSDRILDTGISVRKRVIRIFKDICIEHGDFNKIPEMCVKMIRRVNDEEGIKKLVNEVFQTMWFTPLGTRDKDTGKLVQKVMNITDVVAAAKDTSYEFFEQLLENLLKKDDDGNYNKAAITACKQIVDCLVENVLRIEEKSVEGSEGAESKTSNTRLVGCLSTLYLFSKIKPDLMVEHATTLQPYLDIKCNTQGDFMVLHYVARILELVIPLMDHPSESFLAQVEEDMIKLILKHGMMVVQSCVSCLGAVVNDVSHNYELVKDCFKKFYGVLAKLMLDHKTNKDCPTLKQRRPTLLRALFTVGLLCKHFDLDSKDMGETKVCVRETVFDVLTYFLNHEDEDVQLKALTAIGFFACRHYTFMLAPTLKELYNRLLTDPMASVKLRCQVLRNLQTYLLEEEFQMSKSDADWKKHSKHEDLKEMGDVQSGMASTVMQIYLKELMEAFFHDNSQVRLTALNVVTLVLRQGLVHPVQCIPYLISMGSDIESAIRVKADQQLQEIEKKYPGFTHMKALQGMKASYRLQKVFHSSNPMEPIRGLRYNDENQPQALNAFLYSLLRANRSHRRGLLTSTLNLFDDSARISLEEQVFIADNLAYFVFQNQDEPLFIIHQIDIIVSVTGSNLLQSFRENLLHKHSTGVQNGVSSENLPNGDVNMVEDDDDDDPESLIQKLPENIKPLTDVMHLSQGCILLLVLKQHLKEMYGLTEGKIHRYSPTEAAKVYEKPLNRKALPLFEPQHTLQVLRSTYEEDTRSEEEKRQKLIEDYLEFRDLMMSIDPTDDDDSGDEGRSAGKATPQPGANKSPSHQSDAGEGVSRNGDTSRVEGDGNLDPLQVNSSTSGISGNPSSSSSRSPRISHFPLDHMHHHHSEKRKKSHHHSSQKAHKLLASGGHKTPTVKKKRKKRKRLDSDDDDDSDDDPDFVG